MAREDITPEQLALVAERFRTLGEPTRLRILQVLRDGERTVTEILEETGFGQANVSKHLQLLFAQGFVSRRKQGPSTLYRLSDPQVLRLCDIVCARIEQETEEKRAIMRGR